MNIQPKRSKSTSASQQVSKVEKIDEVSKKLSKAGFSYTVRIVIPAILFILGIVTLPFGIIFWVIALMVAGKR